MDKFLGQEIPEKDIWQFLQDNAACGQLSIIVEGETEG